MARTRSLHIQQWAETIDARARLPLLIRQLVRKTVPDVVRVNFPAWEEVQRPGFDGEVEVGKGNEFVPDGHSAWEMGTDKDVKGKADDDFDKRTAETPLAVQAQTTFVFVTPRTWRKRDQWVKERTDNSQWKGVVALNANDLEHWLNLAPDVDIWFTRLRGGVTHGVQDLDSYWEAVRSIADHPLIPAVFTASREEEVAAVTKWLADPPDALFLQTIGLYDGLDFLAALGSRPDLDRLLNALVTHSADAWRDLAASREPLVLLPSPTLELTSTDIAQAVATGHRVCISAPRANLQSRSPVALRRQDHLALQDALMRSGFSEMRASHFATACCGSSTTLKRLIATHPETAFPAWAKGNEPFALAPFCMIGGWAHVEPTRERSGPAAAHIGSDPPVDVMFVMELAGLDRAGLDACVTRWQQAADPLFVQYGSTVLIASREDAWHLLGGAVSPNQLRRFSDLALLVLEEDNPAFELAPDQRWMANLYGKRHSLSGDFRRSIVETLALMATYPVANQPAPRPDFQAAVRWILERSIPTSAIWERWASFGHNLKIVAEADPEFLLGRVEDDLAAEEPELPKLFQDQSSGVFGNALHTDLLWALEILAWEPRYLQRVSVCLARLAARDPGGSYANRPINSLREIFLTWLPHTNASVDDRVNILGYLVEHEPEMGWRLLCDLLPGRMPTISHPTASPRWRLWAEGWSRERCSTERERYASNIANLTLTAAGLDPGRWAAIIEPLLRSTPGIQARVFAALGQIATSADPNSHDRVKLWNTVGKVVATHSRFADAAWVFEKAILDQLAQLRDQLQPTDQVLRDKWLFSKEAELRPSGQADDPADRHQRLHEARLDSLKHIIAVSGVEGLFRLLDLGADAQQVGWLVGSAQLLDWSSAGLPGILEPTKPWHLPFASSYIVGRFSSDQWKFVSDMPVATWSAAQIETLAKCLPCRTDVWDWVKQFGSEVETTYWKQVVCRMYGNKDVVEIERATRSLIGVGRPLAAIAVVESAKGPESSIPHGLIADVLEAGLAAQDVETVDRDGQLRYAIEELVAALQADAQFDRVRMARIEWGFFSLLDPEFSRVQPVTLFQAVSAEPSFFMELLQQAYRAKSDPPGAVPMTERDQLVARQAHRLIETLRELPGTNAEGEVNAEYFRNWLAQVQTMAAAVDRSEICDHLLGQVIARALRRSGHDRPSDEIAHLIETLGSDELFDGFVIGVLNSRGVVTRDPRGGGNPEKQLSERYRAIAAEARAASRRLAKAYENLADQYDSSARQEDEWAARVRVGR